MALGEILTALTSLSLRYQFQSPTLTGEDRSEVMKEDVSRRIIISLQAFEYIIVFQKHDVYSADRFLFQLMTYFATRSLPISSAPVIEHLFSGRRELAPHGTRS